MHQGKLIHEKNWSRKTKISRQTSLKIAKCLPGLIRPFYGWLLPWLHCCCTVLYRKYRACSETCFESIKQFLWKPDSVACCNLADFCSCLLDRNQEAWVAKRSLTKGVDSFTRIALVHAIFFLLDSNPDSCHSKQAHYYKWQSHPTVFKEISGDFRFQVFSWISFPQAPEYPFRICLKISEILAAQGAQPVSLRF